MSCIGMSWAPGLHTPCDISSAFWCGFDNVPIGKGETIRREDRGVSVDKHAGDAQALRDQLAIPDRE
jgi:hypothetical protein